MEFSKLNNPRSQLGSAGNGGKRGHSFAMVADVVAAILVESRRLFSAHAELLRCCEVPKLVQPVMHKGHSRLQIYRVLFVEFHNNPR